ncbi:hypothetical protein [Metabacillus arenae]|uniref:hypothetical protein n=1 Tax=Metabacillus arenae TaxID=2771434 RepID=UPI002963F1EE|nr:hypothetical protein [Metabacillus arenae]
MYILLTDTGTLFSRAIKLYTRAPYNHASIALDQDLNEIYSFGRKDFRNPINGGFVKETLCSGLFFHKPKTSCAVYELTVDQSTYHTLSNVIKEFERKQAEYRYNLLGLLGILLKKAIERKDAYFCSEFVAVVLRNSGIYPFEKPPSLITPDDFCRVKQFKLIFQGKLIDFKSQRGTYVPETTEKSMKPFHLYPQKL